MTRDYLIEQISEKTGVNEKKVEIFIDNVADTLDSQNLGFTFDGLLGKVPGVFVNNLEYDKENTTVISQDYDKKLANQMGDISAKEVAIVTDFISENAEKYSDNILLNVLGEEVKSQFAQFADRECLTTSISSMIPEKENNANKNLNSTLTDGKNISPEQRDEKSGSTLKEILSLTREHKEERDVLRAEHRKEDVALREERTKKLKEVDDKYENKIKDFLEQGGKPGSPEYEQIINEYISEKQAVKKEYFDKWIEQEERQDTEMDNLVQEQRDEYKSLYSIKETTVENEEEIEAPSLPLFNLPDLKHLSSIEEVNAFENELSDIVNNSTTIESISVATNEIEQISRKAEEAENEATEVIHGLDDFEL